MFTSLRSKIVLLITLIMAGTAIAIMASSRRDVGRAMLDAEQSAAQNVLQLVESSVSAGYNQLVADKLRILAERRQELREFAAIAAASLEQIGAMGKQGDMATEIVQARAIAWLRSLNFSAGELFVFDREGTILGHQNASLEGASLAAVRDLKGRQLTEILTPDNLTAAGELAIFSWRQSAGADTRSREMGYFVPVKPWQWTLGATINFEAIEAESQNSMQSIVDGLSKTFKKINIADSGYVFMFNGEQEILIPPPRVLYQQQMQNQSGRHSPPFEQLMQAAKQERATAINYADPFSEQNELVEAHTGYFKAYDWYFVVVVPVAEIEAPAAALVTRQSVIITLIFLSSLIAMYFWLAKISRPLNILTEYAKQLPFVDFTKEYEDEHRIAHLPLKYKDEVGRLAQALVYMRTELRMNIQAAIEAALREDAAAQANQAKSDFLASMSHELRTPLNGILGYAQILQKYSDLSPHHLEAVNVIRQCGDHLLQLIEEILDLSRIEAGKLELSERDFSLHHLLYPITAMFRLAAERKGLRFNSEIASTLPDSLHGDDRRLRQVLLNLLGNAVKFTTQGEVTLRIATAGNNLCFEVRDSGIGISADKLHDIFLPFTQVNDFRTPVEGAGLGLAISHKLVALMGGELRVESQAGSGSRFWFDVYFPAAKKDLLRQNLEPSQICGFSGPPIDVLVVDDKAANRSMLRSLLEPLGFKCREAGDGLDCLAQVERLRPDLILMDLVMPNMDGFETTRRLRAQEALAEMIIIGLSASTFETHAKQFLDAGCDRFVPKPVQTEQLLETLRETLDLNWIYDAKHRPDKKKPGLGASADCNEIIVDLPKKIAQQLFNAARVGDHSGITQQIADIEQMDQYFEPLADNLAELANTFQFDQICALLQPCLDEKTS